MTSNCQVIWRHGPETYLRPWQTSMLWIFCENNYFWKKLDHRRLIELQIRLQKKRYLFRNTEAS